MNEGDWRSFYGVSGSENLPLVTIIAINWNYATYLEDALGSAVAQDYPALEIIVVDNASDDASQAQIAAFVERHPDIRFIQLATNYGQLGAAHRVFAEHEVAGEFVCFLDTDDVLFPHFISHHVRTHLTCGREIGISSSEALQISAEGAILAAGIPHIRLTMEQEASWTRLPIGAGSTGCAPSTAIWLPADLTGWIWSPGTSNFLRRGAIDAMMASMPTEISKAYSIDTVALRFAHSRAGTLLLEEPLSAYRSHGRNFSSSYPRLQHFNAHRPASLAGTEIQKTWFRTVEPGIAR